MGSSPSARTKQAQASLETALNRRMQMSFALVLIGGMFMWTNQNFFATVEDNIEDGYSWESLGKQVPDGSPAITLQHEETGEESIYFKMTK